MIIPAFYTQDYLKWVVNEVGPGTVVYGSFPWSNRVASARPEASLPKSSLRHIEHWIGQARDLNVAFVYAWNAPCTGNGEWTAEGQRDLGQLARWLVDAGAHGVVSANPFIIRMIKERFSQLVVHIYRAWRGSIPRPKSALGESSGPIFSTCRSM